MKIPFMGIKWPAPAHFLGIREKTGIFTKIILGTVPIVILVFVWVLLTNGKHENRMISPLILPSPYEVLASFKSLWFEAELSRSIVASTLRVICGFLAGLLVAFPLGLSMGSFSKVKAMFNPFMTFAAYLPIPALLPLTMSLFGIGELQKVMFLALAFFIYLLPLFVKTVDEVDNIYLQTAFTLGATKWQTVRRVLLGISSPKLFHAMRLGFGVGWTYIILAEMVAADRGLGQIIIVAQRRGPREHIYLVLVVIVIIAYFTDKLWVKLGRKLFPYLEEK
jgi:ABC-type nitrate/sulfonate/bicarbonate transport system permease component